MIGTRETETIKVMIEITDGSGKVIFRPKTYAEADDFYAGKIPPPPPKNKIPPSGNAPQRVKILCGTCDGKGIITPLFNSHLLRSCVCCGGKGFHFEEKVKLPVTGFWRRFKRVLGF